MLKPYLNSNRIEAGVDEVGRGCLAGPVVAAAVILPENHTLVGLNDSKKINKKLREELFLGIKEQAIAYAIAEASIEEIDSINILNASFLAMHRALEQLKPPPDFLLIDGNRFTPYKEVPFECIIKGDGKFASIAAASILAKVYRDRLMEDLGNTFPDYAWSKNVGYPTKDHRSAIQKYGVTMHHRKSFRLLENQLELFQYGTND